MKWLLALAVFSFSAHAEIQTVPFVDVSKYLGDWYQIAHVPLWFEGGNCACARQRLTPAPGGVGVFNSCTKDDGTLNTIKGTATVDDRVTNAKLTVSFEGVPVKGSYWIIGLGRDYRYAVVTSQSGNALYILSKTPTLATNLYNEAVRIAARQVDTSKLVVTPQRGCRYPQ